MKIQLDSVWKARNQSEGRYVPRARCGDLEEVGDHKIIQGLCRQLANRGELGVVEVFRGDQLIFKATPIQTWAKGKALSGPQPEHLRK